MHQRDGILTMADRPFQIACLPIGRGERGQERGTTTRVEVGRIAAGLFEVGQRLGGVDGCRLDHGGRHEQLDVEVTTDLQAITHTADQAAHDRPGALQVLRLVLGRGQPVFSLWYDRVPAERGECLDGLRRRPDGLA